jgi:hypothetical protein
MCSLFRDIYREGHTLPLAHGLTARSRHGGRTRASPMVSQVGIYPAGSNNGKDYRSWDYEDPSLYSDQ